jgi:hypothetical protein
MAESTLKVADKIERRPRKKAVKPNISAFSEHKETKEMRGQILSKNLSFRNEPVPPKIVGEKVKFFSIKASDFKNNTKATKYLLRELNIISIHSGNIGSPKVMLLSDALCEQEDDESVEYTRIVKISDLMKGVADVSREVGHGVAKIMSDSLNIHIGAMVNLFDKPKTEAVQSKKPDNTELAKVIEELKQKQEAHNKKIEEEFNKKLDDISEQNTQLQQVINETHTKTNKSFDALCHIADVMTAVSEINQFPEVVMAKKRLIQDAALIKLKAQEDGVQYGC